MVDLQRVAARVAEAKIEVAHQKKLDNIAQDAEAAKREAQRVTVLAKANLLGLDNYQIVVQEGDFKRVIYGPIDEQRLHYHGANYDLSYEYALKSLAQLAEDEDKLVALFLRERIIYDYEVPGTTLTVGILKATPRKTGMTY